MKKFILKVMAIIIPIGLLVFIVNIVVDPACLFFRKKEIKEVSKLLTEGNIVAGNLNVDERILQREFIQMQKDIPQSIIIGSSRVMPISDSMASELLKTIGSKNHGMSGSVLNDYYGILGCYSQFFTDLPKNVVIGVDPWCFNGTCEESRYVALSNEITIAKDLIKNNNEGNKQILYKKYFTWTESIAPAYFQASINGIFFNRSKAGIEYTVVSDEKETEAALRRPDGSIRHELSYINKDEQEVLADVKSDIARDSIYQMYSHFPDVDMDLWNEFSELITYLQNNNVKVTFYLPPFHPLFYEYFETNSNYNGVIESEEKLRQYAEEKGIPVYGSYNPEKLSLTENDFTDGIHLRDYKIKDALIICE